MAITESPAPPIPSPKAAPPRIPPAPEKPSSSIWLTRLGRAPIRRSISSRKPACRFGLRLALPSMRKRDVLSPPSTEYTSLWNSSFQYNSDRLTQPLKVSDTRRLPLRTVVASSSAMRSSRSAQQPAARSAAKVGYEPAALARTRPATTKIRRPMRPEYPAIACLSISDPVHKAAARSHGTHGCPGSASRLRSWIGTALRTRRPSDALRDFDFRDGYRTLAADGPR